MLQSSGTYHYSDDGRLVVDVDPELAAYYRALIPKSMSVCKPRWPPHITVVRSGKEVPVHREYWGAYEGWPVEFDYDSSIQIDKTYYWLNVWCEDLVYVRTELGIPSKSRWTLPPSGGHQCFHLTIANKKGA